MNDDFKNKYYELEETLRLWNKNKSEIDEIIRSEGLIKNVNNNDIVDCLEKMRNCLMDFEFYTKCHSFNSNAFDKYTSEKIKDIYKVYSKVITELRMCKEFNLVKPFLEINNTEQNNLND